MENQEANWELITKLNKDLRDGARLLSRGEARYLVDLYYQVQDTRKRAASQGRTQDEAEEPHALVTWLFDQFHTLENDVKKALDSYSKSKAPGVWAQSIHGIGPVIAAGLLAHVDPQRAETAGAVWRFAGLDPTVTWGKGEKRPWNARLKRLCWIIGDSFVKHRNSDKDVYGKVYEERKALEVERNESGQFAEQAAQSLASKKVRDADLKATLESGKLPDGRIDLRARRYAVKLFLSHYHHVIYEDFFEKEPPRPYIIEHGGHTHFVAPPNWPI